jgi:thiamine kinase-like enzyme
MMSEIKLTHKQDIDNALHSIMGNLSWEVKRHLSQGASAAIYLIECDGKNFIARISDPNRPGANIPMELHCMGQASNCGVAPHLYYQNSEKNISIMEYINTQPLPLFNQCNEGDIKKLAGTIAKLHAGKAFPKSHSTFDTLTQISNAVKHYFPNDKHVEDALNKIPILESLLDIEIDRKPSHRDLHGFNVIYDGKQYYFIDWESSGNDSLYFDLAVAANTLIFKMPGGESILLNAYFKNEPTQEQLAKFKLMRVFAYFYYGFILLYLSAAAQEPRLNETDITKLKPFSEFIEQQIEENNPNMAGRFLKFGYASFREAIKQFETASIQDAINMLSKAD